MPSSPSKNSTAGTVPPPSPPPPPTPPSAGGTPAPAPAPQPPAVAAGGPPEPFLVELLIYNGHPFKDHWAYWVCSRINKETGVKLHATGDVRNGFEFEIKRSSNLHTTEIAPHEKNPAAMGRRPVL